MGNKQYNIDGLRVARHVGKPPMLGLSLKMDRK